MPKPDPGLVQMTKDSRKKFSFYAKQIDPGLDIIIWGGAKSADAFTLPPDTTDRTAKKEE